MDMKFEEPLRPGIAPTTTCILHRSPNHPDSHLWDLLVDESLDYDPHSGSVASNSDEEKVDSSSGASDAPDSDSFKSSSGTSSSSSSSSSSSAAAANASTSKKKCTTKKAYLPKRKPSVEDTARKKTKAM